MKLKPMQSDKARVALMSMAAAALALFPTGAHADTTAYEMFGGGTLTVSDSPGLGFGTGADVNNWTFGDVQGNPGGLIIPGAGQLLGQMVAGAYNCSNSTVTTRGGAQNFTLEWTFTCARDQGLGPELITGHFGSLAPGSFVWPGYFRIGTDGPQVDATCSGGFVPTATGVNFTTQRVTQVYFGGECTAAGA